MRKVKLDHLQKVLPQISSDAWFSTLVLSRGYYHLRVNEEQKELLGFEWEFQDGEHAFFEWEVAFLGISDLVYFFTKVVKLGPRKLGSRLQNEGSVFEISAEKSGVR